MITKNLNQLYREQLIRVGVKPNVAESAASLLTSEELYLIKDIWSEWAMILAQFEEENSPSSCKGKAVPCPSSCKGKAVPCPY